MKYVQFICNDKIWTVIIISRGMEWLSLHWEVEDDVEWVSSWQDFRQEK